MLLMPINTVFSPQLVIPHVTEQNSGVYVCTATNNFGLAYRQAQLSVYDQSAGSNTLLVVVGVVCVVAVVAVIIVIIMVRKVHTHKPPPPRTANEGALLPPQPMSQAKVQPPPGHHPRYIPGLHTAQPQTPHGHSVGPENALLQYAGGVVHLPPQSMAGTGQGAQPIIVYQDPATAASVYIAQRPPTQTASRPEYQYQHLDVI
ncbi:hypothetical protein GWK47_001765 [Chionoecetes opilio]|uniref:Uncharacterized protein n=1 Tax=Chionoecetes opilio TaxID=41210 RepID=A0A8J4XRY9_CHIOP|nr:hypothetical protein GWK47_001765 [Chionoecetes opilio]